MFNRKKLNAIEEKVDRLHERLDSLPNEGALALTVTELNRRAKETFEKMRTATPVNRGSRV